MRRTLILLGLALVAVTVVVGFRNGNGGVPGWMVTRVHELVVSDQSQAAQIAQLQQSQRQDEATIVQDETTIAQLQSQAQQLAAEQACIRPLGVSVARVRSETGRTRMVLRLSVAGAAPVYRLARFRAAC